MLGTGDTAGGRDSETQQTIAHELAKLAQTDSAFARLFSSLWDALEESPRQFLKFGTKAYHHLGVCDEVRDFIARIWGSAMAAWDETNRQDFLFRILREDHFFLFQALDFAPRIFQSVPIDPRFMASWVKEARQAVGNDLHQRGLWSCFQSYARGQPDNALQLIEHILAYSLNPQLRTVIARILSWIRSSDLEPDLRQKLRQIEGKLRMTGAPDLRSVYFESWAYAAGTNALDEVGALSLRDELLGNDGEQLDSWTFMLAQVVGANDSGWGWAFRELVELAQRPMDASARHWVIGAALAGWAAAQMEGPVTRSEWADLFFSLPPIEEDEANHWQNIEHTIVDMLAADPDSAKQFLLQLAGSSGVAWAKRLEAEREHFSWLHSRLRETGNAQAVVTAMCFAPGSAARRVGVKMFGKCHLTDLLPEAVAAATPVQLELLILQTTLGLTEHRATARIHASIARRIDELGGDLSETFYDEVITEAMNTHGYRESLTQHAEGHLRLLKCIAEANRRLDATISALESPALKMLVPGRARAEALGMRRMGRLIQKGMSENSLLSHFCTTVPILYGRTWRMLDLEGNLTTASEMTKSEVSTELPRYEFVTPEEMRLRRLAASARIAMLQQREVESA